MPKDVENTFDLGFLGVQKDYPEQKSSLPIRKERDRKLTEIEKEYNKNHSKRRIVIEHAICRTKEIQDTE